MIKIWFFYLALVLLTLTFFSYQYMNQQKLRDRLKIRIVVNGTRGKSSTTRLIVAGLEAGLSELVLGKTTGTQPRWLLPEGKEKVILRKGQTNIREIAEGLTLANQLGATAYVAECMAIQPEYQKIIEEKWMKSHIVVITNIRHDHEDILGEGLPAIAKALSASLPKEGVLVTTQEARDLIKQVADFPEERIRIANLTCLKEEWLLEFKEPIIKENLALALEVCEELGIPFEKALLGMKRANTDPGNLEIRTLRFPNQKINFVGAFAANDPESTQLISDGYPAPKDALKGLWIHGREDRRQRTQSLCKGLRKIDPDFIILSGDSAFTQKIWQESNGIPNHGFIQLPLDSSNELEVGLKKLPENRSLWILGIGNTKGMIAQQIGEEWICQKLSSEF